METLNWQPSDYPDHLTWISDLAEQIRQDDEPWFVHCEEDNPMELERRCRILAEQFGEELDAIVDVDHIVVSRIG